MKIQEVISEAKMRIGLKTAMANAGFTLLGSGQDQDVYLDPRDKTIIKIFGTDVTARVPSAVYADGSGVRLSKGQKSIVDFINFCHSDENNPFLLTFCGWETFVFENRLYLQIRCERLFPFGNAGIIAKGLEAIASRIQYEKTNFDTFMRDTVGTTHFNSDSVNALLMLDGRDDLKILWDTIGSLKKIANRKGYGLDLHSGNFMLSSDNHNVISDPFFTGTFRD